MWGRKVIAGVNKILKQMQKMVLLLTGLSVIKTLTWYTYVEKFAGIQGSYEKLAAITRWQFLPAMEMNVVEKDVAARIKAHYNNKRTLIIGRTAHITGP